MSTFPDIKPTYGTRKSNAPINRVVRFAAGFEQRIVFGLALAAAIQAEIINQKRAGGLLA